MSEGSGMDDVIRVRIESEKKTALNRVFESKGTTISEEVRRFLDEQLLAESDALDRFDAIMASADERIDAYGAPEPTVDDIVSFVDRIREQRVRDTAA